MTSRCACRTTGEREWTVAALLSAALGWGMFAVAVVFSTLYSDSQRMRGFEWVPGFLIVPLAWIGFLRWPPSGVGQGVVFSSADERSVNDTAINLRIGYIILMVMAGIIMGGIFVTVEWFVPPASVSTSSSSSLPTTGRGLHISPSPQPTPPDAANVQGDPITGTILLVHYALLALTIFFQYMAVTAPTPHEDEDEAIEMH